MSDLGHPGRAEDTREFLVTAAEAGQRLDAFLGNRCPELSRNRIQGDLAEGRVLVDDRPRPKSFRLKEGTRVRYLPGERPPLVAVAQDIPLKVVYRDDDILIIDKPAGLVVHPAVGNPEGTLVNALLHLCGGLSTGSDPLRPGIVHRLDRDTTGLLAVALNDRAHRHLAAQLRDRRMGRTYLALSWGAWGEDEGILRGDIGRHPRDRRKMAVVAEGGRKSTTGYRVLASFGFVQLCRVKLETGRTHQIRVHFAHHHHPVVGDAVYGDDGRARTVHPLDHATALRLVQTARRQMLHAVRLELEHPVSGETLSFTAPVPEDLALALELLAGGKGDPTHDWTAGV